MMKKRRLKKGMKRKRLWMLTVSILVAGCLISAGHAAQEDPDVMTMDSTVYEKHKKGLVTFTHKKHTEDYKIACADCHHAYQNGKNTWKKGDPVQKCQACHKETGKPEKGMGKQEKITRFHKEALHENCVTCHKTLKKEGKDAPTKCTDCHPKQS
jgi:hypothetical protein